MPRRTTKPTLVVALAIVAALFLAVACGPAATPTPTSTPMPTPTPVVVEKVVVATPTPGPTPTPVVVERIVVATPTPGPTPTPVVVERIVVATPTPAPATPTPTPVRVKPRGEVVIGVEQVNPLVQLPEKDARCTTCNFGVKWEIYETLIRIVEPSPPPVLAPVGTQVGGVAESWVIGPDLGKITWKIRKGIQFHARWGEVTAKDVAFSFNNAIKEGSTGKGGDVQPKGHKLPWEVIDDYTVVQPIKKGEYDLLWPLGLDNGASGSISILSKKAYDELGPDKFNVTPIGTGPFKVIAWRANDEVVAEALEEHWRVVPKVKTARYVQMTETAAREAALRTGQIHITMMPNKLLGRVLAATGSRAINIGIPRPQVIFFAGNYWGTTDMETGAKDIFPRPGFKPDAEHPWIGDPRDPARMESARKVRWAMAMVIDRQKIVDTVMRGFGRVIYTHSNIRPDDSLHRKEWIIPFDPEKAKQFLREAGYPKGFKMTMWVTPDYPSAWDPEIGDAVAEMWRYHLGLDVSIEKTVYAARRPSTVDKTINIPFLHGVNYHTPLQAPAAFQCAKPGHIAGVEMEDSICEIGYRNFKELDPQKRIQNTIQVQDYMSYWMVNSPIAQLTTYFVARPEVLEWSPFMGLQEEFNSPHTIVMK